MDVVSMCVPGYRLGGGYHRDKLGAVGDLLLYFRTGSNVGPHLYQSHLGTHTHKRTSGHRKFLLNNVIYMCYALYFHISYTRHSQFDYLLMYQIINIHP